MAINLDEAEWHVTAIKERGRIRHKARAPQYFDYRPAPLRLTQDGQALEFGAYHSQAAVEVMLYDFGAVTVIYRIPLDDPFEGLLGLSETLYENDTLRTESRRRLEQLVRDIHPAVERPTVSNDVEDHLLFCQSNGTPLPTSTPSAPSTSTCSPACRSEATPLSDQEIDERPPVALHSVGTTSPSSTGMPPSSSDRTWTMCGRCWNS